MGANDKAASVWHGATCSGACCSTHRGLGVCFHGRACQFHLKEEAARIKHETEQSAILEFRKMWDIR